MEPTVDEHSCAGVSKLFGKERGLTPCASGLYTQNKTTYRARVFCESEFEDVPALLTLRQADF